MKTILAGVLILVGGVLFVQGLNRRDSIAGQVAVVGTTIANSFNGGARQPRHVVMMVTGGACVLAGIGLFFRRGSAAR